MGFEAEPQRRGRVVSQRHALTTRPRRPLRIKQTNQTAKSNSQIKTKQKTILSYKQIKQIKHIKQKNQTNKQIKQKI